MLSENGVILDANDVIHILRVMIPQVCEYIQLYTRLMVKALLVPNYLHSHVLVCFVVKAF